QGIDELTKTAASDGYLNPKHSYIVLGGILAKKDPQWFVQTADSEKAMAKKEKWPVTVVVVSSVGKGMIPQVEHASVSVGRYLLTQYNLHAPTPHIITMAKSTPLPTLVQKAVSHLPVKIQTPQAVTPWSAAPTASGLPMVFPQPISLQVTPVMPPALAKSTTGKVPPVTIKVPAPPAVKMPQIPSAPPILSKMPHPLKNLVNHMPAPFQMPFQMPSLPAMPNGPMANLPNP
ncbi:MAG: hypothetical protein OWS74_09200, partial [Firmicutes bacterium]|nr:hypothetical protein [Bacillota bacterium]